jgi:predicted NBD/HSP70 family sugar kinase
MSHIGTGAARTRGTMRTVGVSAQVLGQVLDKGPLSRAQLRRGTGAALSTVTNAVQDLIASGLVVESGFALSTGGRPAGILDLGPKVGGVLGTDIGAINLRVAAADCRGTILFSETKAISGLSARRIRSLIVRLNEKARSHFAGPVRAMGVAIAGIVDPHTGRISDVVIPDWPDGDDFTWLDLFDAPLLVDNEANLAALGEHQAGVAVGVADMIFVAIGAGIGAGLILNERLYRGATGAAGEIGLFRHSEASGSVELERRAAAGAVIEAYALRTGRRLATAEAVFERLMAGDRAAVAAVGEIVGELCIGIANAILLFNPTLVVIGGGLGGAGDTLLVPLRRRIAELVPVMPRIEPSRLGPEAALVGAVRWASGEAQVPLMLESEGRFARA